MLTKETTSEMLGIVVIERSVHAKLELVYNITVCTVPVTKKSPVQTTRTRSTRQLCVSTVHSELSLQTDYSDSGFKLLHTATEAQ